MQPRDAVRALRQAQTSLHEGVYPRLLALISLSLAIFNLLPFLPLDGGHVLMIALERIRGKMVSRAVFERVSVLGIMLMALLFVVGLQNDLSSILNSQPH